MKYGIVAFPSKKLQDLANTYRKRYDSHYSKITPHITLMEPFEADDEQIKSVSETIESIVKKYKPLPIHATKISSFFPITNVIYFKIEPTNDLQKLHDELYEKVKLGKKKHVFVPHITIARDITDAEHDDIFGQLRLIGINEKDTIDRIHLVYQLNDGSWTTYETYKLVD